MDCFPVSTGGSSSCPATATRSTATSLPPGPGKMIRVLRRGKHTDGALGTTALWLAPIAAGRATAGYSVAPRSRGRGIVGQTLTALTRFAWSIPELDRIELHIEPWNVASARTAGLAGYEREGLLRSHREVGGNRVDMLLYAAIRRIG